MDPTMAKQLIEDTFATVPQQTLPSRKSKDPELDNTLHIDTLSDPESRLNRIAYLFGATIIIEQIFNWPGLGHLLWQATQDRDIPLLLGGVIIYAIVIRTTHFCARLIYVLINPRASHE